MHFNNQISNGQKSVWMYKKKLKTQWKDKYFLFQAKQIFLNKARTKLNTVTTYLAQQNSAPPSQYQYMATFYFYMATFFVFFALI